MLWQTSQLSSREYHSVEVMAQAMPATEALNFTDTALSQGLNQKSTSRHLTQDEDHLIPPQGLTRSKEKVESKGLR